MEEEKEYYLSTLDENGAYLIYTSEGFKLSEIDVINLIKICLIEARSKTIGRKILEVYKDSNKKLAEEKLKKIGIENNEAKPIRKKKAKTR